MNRNDPAAVLTAYHQATLAFDGATAFSYLASTDQQQMSRDLLVDMYNEMKKEPISQYWFKNMDFRVVETIPMTDDQVEVVCEFTQPNETTRRDLSQKFEKLLDHGNTWEEACRKIKPFLTPQKWPSITQENRYRLVRENNGWAVTRNRA